MGGERVVVLSMSFDPFVSGAERMVKEVVERLAGRFDFFVVTARLDRKLPKKEIRQAGGGSYTVIRVGLGSPADKYLFPLLAAPLAKRLAPKVVHAVMESYAGIALWLYKLLGGRAFSALTLQSGNLDLPEYRKRIPRFVWRRIHLSPDLIVSIGSSMAERAERLGAKNVRIIPNGVDLEGIRPLRSAERVSGRIVSVARLSAEKGLEYLLEAMPAIRREIAAAELILIGWGDLEASLKYRTERLGLAERVKFLGKLPNREALNEVAKSSVFVLPSLGEGQGIVLVEAQALGVPVVATSVGGIPDVVKNGETGLLVAPKDSPALSEAIVRILNNPELAERLARNAEQALGKYDWNVIAESYAEIYLAARR